MYTKAWETELLNVKLFCLLVCLLGQHEQKKYLFDANNHSADKGILITMESTACSWPSINAFVAHSTCGNLANNKW